MKHNTYKKLILSTLAIAISSSLSAAETTQAEEVQVERKGLDFERIVVTGAAGKGSTVMASSVSVSSLSADQIEVSTPRNAAETFRTIPGIRTESSGGDGNANIAVRGLPVADGGGKFLQIQEDGLPIVQFGDIAFGNADIFLRIDSTMASVDSIRGGSASTTATNAPGGIINIVSKDGSGEGGSVSTTLGLDYDSTRTDFEFGSSINDSTFFHIGGFYRQGEGVRETGYTGNKGGQIKANLTKELDNGYVKLYFKHLDDQSTAYLPMPTRNDGSSVPGLDSTQDTIHSAYLTTMVTFDAAGNKQITDMRDGMNPQVDSVGFEAVFDLGNDWTLENRMRKSSISGAFRGPFNAGTDFTQSMADSIGGVGSVATYANGPQAGEVFEGDQLMRIHTFDVDMTDMDFMVNDFKLIKSIGDTSITVGYYASSQNIEQNWSWNTYISEIKGDNAALIDITALDGTPFTDNGLAAYGVPAWGCCTESKDLTYDVRAPYLAVNTAFANVTIDASLRYDSGEANGTVTGRTNQAVDVDGDGNISKVEESVAIADFTNQQTVNYDWGYLSYSLGANFTINDDIAVFGRLSRGGAANADRKAAQAAAGGVKEEEIVNMVDQFEVGVKYRSDNLSLFATLFNAETEVNSYDATEQRFLDRVYEATGLELEGVYYIGDFDIRGNFTWTDAEISKDALNPEFAGNQPQRQPEFIYSLTARYNFDDGSAGLNLIGTGEAFSADNVDQSAADASMLEAYAQVNAFAKYYLSDEFSVALNINNLFDTVGTTEGSTNTAAGQYASFRTIAGRSSSITFKYEF